MGSPRPVLEAGTRQGLLANQGPWVICQVRSESLAPPQGHGEVTPALITTCNWIQPSFTPECPPPWCTLKLLWPLWLRCVMLASTHPPLIPQTALPAPPSAWLRPPHRGEEGARQKWRWLLTGWGPRRIKSTLLGILSGTTLRGVSARSPILSWVSSQCNKHSLSCCYVQVTVLTAWVPRRTCWVKAVYHPPCPRLVPLS